MESLTDKALLRTLNKYRSLTEKFGAEIERGRACGIPPADLLIKDFEEVYAKYSVLQEVVMTTYRLERGEADGVKEGSVDPQEE